MVPEPGEELQDRQEEKTQKDTALLKQNTRACCLWWLICTGQHAPFGALFNKFCVFTTNTIPNNNHIDQPQKWRLIHSLNSHRVGREHSVNAGIDEGDFLLTYPSIGKATLGLFCTVPSRCVVWGRDIKAYDRHPLKKYGLQAL